MKTNSYVHWAALPFVLVIISIACSGSAGTDEPRPPDATSTGSNPTTPEATATPSEQVTLEPATLIPVTAPGDSPRCTVLQDLNLRSGPGTAYNPPIMALPANTELVPLAYNPVGYPGGSWAQVRDPASQKEGWVSAGSVYISCNIDLTTLSSVTVAPPQPQRPSAKSSNPDGSCGEGGVFDEQNVHVYDCAVIFSDGFPIQFQVFKDGQEIGNGEGVQNVTFRVDEDGNTIYSNTEETDDYCAFGGDGPCNPWVLEDYVYKWESGGAVIEAGEYIVNIDAVVNDPFINLHWDATVTITP
jgi:hypothetical protein